MIDPQALEHAPVDALLAFHHIGVACVSIEAARTGYEILGYCSEGEAFEDPLQGVRGLFLTGPGPRLELLETLLGRTTLKGWLNGRVNMYHLAYETSSLEQASGRLRDKGAKVVSPAKPAVAFGGRPVSFLMLPNMTLIELIGSSVETVDV